MTIQEILKDSTIEGNVLKLPLIQLDRKDYCDVKKSLELIGGKWKSGKVQGFVFDSDPTILINNLLGDKSPEKLKKDYQFFATPTNLASELVALAEIHIDNKILEPSAGQGAIIKEIMKCGIKIVDYFELMPTNQFILKEINGVNLIGDDFLNANDCPIYDRIIANPPFSKNQDIEHIQKMYKLLKEGGILVTIASKHWQQSNNKKEIAFRKWLTEMNAEIIDIEKGTFKESGTNIETVIIKIIK
jgi:phospholipid N-methyltransferase